MAQSTFTPNPMQSSLMAIAWNDPEVQNILLAGGSRGGKSAGIMALVIMRALAAPNTKHGIFRLTLTNCNKQLGPARGTFPEVLDLLYPGIRQQWEKLPNAGTFKNDSIYRFPNGSEILFEGLDKTRIDNVLGGEYSTVWVNECNQIKDYEDVILQLASRMNGRGFLESNGKPVLDTKGDPVPLRPLTIFDCNPAFEDDWECQLFRDHKDPLSGQPLDYPEWYKLLKVPTEDNAANQAANYQLGLKARYKHSSKQMARFVLGEWSTNNPLALFKREWFKWGDVKKSDLVKIVVAVDPSGNQGNKGDYTGIVVAGIDASGHVWVLEDASLKATPEVWAEKAIAMYDDWQADYIVAEKNFGGEMVRTVINGVRRNAPLKLVNATRAKIVRAQPVAIQYSNGNVTHLDGLKELEAQMMDYDENAKKSPDRMDALVWALTELLRLNGGASGETRLVRHGLPSF